MNDLQQLKDSVQHHQLPGGGRGGFAGCSQAMVEADVLWGLEPSLPKQRVHNVLCTRYLGSEGSRRQLCCLVFGSC